MCGVSGSVWVFAYRDTSRLKRDTVVEQCSECGDYRKRPVSDIEFVDG